MSPLQSENTKRIAKNTLMLYGRMLISMLVSLYTSRIVLRTLGVEDYGIYNVVGGVVSMLSFLNASMSGATSRFLAYEIGRGDEKVLNETFSTAFIIHLLVAIVVLVISETVGLWFLENKLVIPEERMHAARIVYQFSIFATLLGITQVPYNACIIAREKMNIYAYVEILNVVLRLLIVYLLVIGNYDKLILYALLQFLVSVVVLFTYRYYSISRYKETKLRLIFKKDLLCPMLTFSGWDMFGNLSMVARGQGVNMLLNTFFGPKVNAASGVATSVMSITTSFSNNFLMALKPYMTKQYAREEYSGMIDSIFMSSKMAYLLVSFFSIPIILECNFILNLWLTDTPRYAVSFCQLILIQQVVASTSQPIIQAIHATSKIRFLSVFNGSINILIIPLSYFILKYSWLDPNVCYLLNIGLSFVAVISNMCNLSQKIEFPLYKYIKSVIIPCYVSFVLILLMFDRILSFLTEGWSRFIIVILIYLVAFIATSYFVIINKEERFFIKNILLNFKKKCLQKYLS